MGQSSSTGGDFGGYPGGNGSFYPNAPPPPGFRSDYTSGASCGSQPAGANRAGGFWTGAPPVDSWVTCLEIKVTPSAIADQQPTIPVLSVVIVRVDVVPALRLMKAVEREQPPVSVVQPADNHFFSYFFSLFSSKLLIRSDSS